MADKRMTAKKRMHLAAYADAVRMLDVDSPNVVRCAQRVPDAWHSVHDAPDTFCRKNVKVTFLVSRDVLTYFKKMGPGHGKRMNRVLTAYVHGRLAGIVEGPDVTDFVLRPQQVKRRIGARRPEWGESSWWEELEG